MDSLFSFFSQKKPAERAESKGDDEEEPTTTEYYSGASDSGSDVEMCFKEPPDAITTQFSLELETQRSRLQQRLSLPEIKVEETDEAPVWVL